MKTKLDTIMGNCCLPMMMIELEYFKVGNKIES